QRGEFGAVAEQDVEKKVADIIALMRRPEGGQIERRTLKGRFVQFNWRTLADGSLLGVYRDVTELKDREEALDQARGIMQSVLANMRGGSALFDSGHRLKFANQRVADFLRIPAEHWESGTPLIDLLRYQARRGDFGPAAEAEKLANARFEFIVKPGGAHFE